MELEIDTDIIKMNIAIHCPISSFAQPYNLGGKVSLPASATTVNVAKQPQKMKTGVSRQSSKREDGNNNF